MPVLNTLNDNDIVYIISGGQDYHTTWGILKAGLNYRMNNLDIIYCNPNNSTDVSFYDVANFKGIKLDYFFIRGSRYRKGEIVIQNDATNVYLYEQNSISIPLDDDCGLTLTVDIHLGNVRLILTTDNSDSEIAQFKYYSQTYA